MKQDLEKEKKNLISYLQISGALKSSEIISAFKKVKRENFVSKKLKPHAYEDSALPIEEGATISQPTTIATMLELLNLGKGQKILEAGSGCGYALALINEIVGSIGQIFGIEINHNLVNFSKKILSQKKNITIIEGDAYQGLKKYAPFDRILVSAGAGEIPESLVEQLNPDGGIMVVPVGQPYTTQKMLRIIKKKDKIDIQEKGYFVFVPLQKK